MFEYGVNKKLVSRDALNRLHQKVSKACVADIGDRVLYSIGELAKRAMFGEGAFDVFCLFKSVAK